MLTLCSLSKQTYNEGFERVLCKMTNQVLCKMTDHTLKMTDLLTTLYLTFSKVFNETLKAYEASQANV